MRMVVCIRERPRHFRRGPSEDGSSGVDFGRTFGFVARGSVLEKEARLGEKGPVRVAQGDVPLAPVMHRTRRRPD